MFSFYITVSRGGEVLALTLAFDGQYKLAERVFKVARTFDNHEAHCCLASSVASDANTHLKLLTGANEIYGRESAEVGETYINLGNYCRRQNQPAVARDCYLRAITILAEGNDAEAFIEALCCLGATELDQKNIKAANDAFNLALSKLGSHSDKAIRASLLLSLLNSPDHNLDLSALNGLTCKLNSIVEIKTLNFYSNMRVILFILFALAASIVLPLSPRRISNLF